MTPPLRALTREVPESIAQCELSHLARTPIDLVRAVAQHTAYEAALAGLGCLLERLAPEPGMPDSVFVEDTAVVLDEVAIITRPGALSRRGETTSVAAALARYRSLVVIEEPGTIDGGDVLRIGRKIFVGRSERTDEEGIRQLSVAATPLGYTVIPLPLRGCLHLKTAVTEVADSMVLLNPEWIDGEAFAGYEVLTTGPGEPFAANALRVGNRVLFPSAFPRTLEILQRRGLDVVTIEADELARAEGGLTCGSLIFR